MNRLIAVAALVLVLCAPAYSQNYDITWFYIPSVDTSTTYAAETIGPFEGKVVSAAFLALSNMTVGLYATNVNYQTVRAVVPDVTNMTTSIGYYTNLAETIYLARDHLFIRGKLNVDASGASGYLKGYVIIQK